ncbi:MAG: anti-sigma factor family protein [Candidatus Saccharicenans sp.]|uniref:anti-sigma factor family protein n=1 Tax=Candidatus Saccharicenans sp. TaxID=2819258 RepID=UPI004049CBBF
MKKCRQYKKDWPGFISRQLTPERMDAMSRHLQACSFCREELEQQRRLLAMADNFKEELKQVMATVDWESLPAVIASRLPEKEECPVTATADTGWRLWKWQPLAAGLFLGLVLGGALTFLVFRNREPGQPTTRQETGIFMPAELVDRVDLALARKETIDYLEKSQYLLLDILQTGEAPASTLLQQERIRQLLTDKKYLNNQLDDLRLMKARAICNQIELLFLELSQLSPEVSAAELERLRKMIEDKQLLLKINLVKKELQQSEV